MLKLDEFNRILTVHYSYISLVSSDECVELEHSLAHNDKYKMQLEFDSCIRHPVIGAIAIHSRLIYVVEKHNTL